MIPEVPMKMLLCCLAVAAILSAPALPAPALAAEPANYEADARLSGGNPPTIPHKVADDASGQFCNSCHRAGLKGAPKTPHPERLICTQCHVRSDTGAPGPAARKGKTRK